MVSQFRTILTKHTGAIFACSKSLYMTTLFVWFLKHKHDNSLARWGGAEESRCFTLSQWMKFSNWVRWPDSGVVQCGVLVHWIVKYRECKGEIWSSMIPMWGRWWCNAAAVLKPHQSTVHIAIIHLLICLKTATSESTISRFLLGGGEGWQVGHGRDGQLCKMVLHGRRAFILRTSCYAGRQTQFDLPAKNC